MTKVGKTKTTNLKITGIVGLLILFFAVVYFAFIQDYPRKKGKKSASEMCKCYDAYNRDMTSAHTTFLNNFDQTKYTHRKEAIQALQAILKPIKDKKADCIWTVNNAYLLLEEQYKNNPKKLNKLSTAYSQNNCTTTKSDSIHPLYNDIVQKVKRIKEPEPDESKIKNDLIGKGIPGWIFDYLSEFKNVEILDVIKTDNRLEYDIELLLYGANSGMTLNGEVIVVYQLKDDGWNFDSVTMKYITYNNTYYPDSWSETVPLTGCSWEVENKYRMAWKTDPSDYARIIKTGPTLGGKNLLPDSDVYYIKSLEGKEIKVKFTYRLD